MGMDKREWHSELLPVGLDRRITQKGMVQWIPTSGAGQMDNSKGDDAVNSYLQG